ncbi:pyridoxal phosphate-dependent aminotransferase [Xenorhabdus bovienii]|uniref:Aminotransferase n=1 Tax=Xenorhabdus bovienii str. feltiae Moldova TaxID=1398200 RepID=A0A077NLN7_XENBV|nr:histidinol-phosphate transaminase [Xenorhabdus bovienii]CDH03052.1 conserved hypothetical protein [Xenorhabdus bovienii str. feltiae Moldova]
MNRIDLSKNESPFNNLNEISNDIFKVLPYLNRYPKDLNISNRLAEYHKINRDNIYIGNGAADVIFKILSTLDITSVTFSTPCFDGFKYMMKSLNLNENLIPLFENGSQDFNGLINSNSSDIVILCNPHNPTGELLSIPKIDALLKCLPKNKYIILDEVYIDYANEHFDSLPLLKSYNNLIIVRSFSKSFGLAGLRIGYCIASKEIINLLENKTLPNNVNSISSVAACSALNNIHKIKSNIKNTITERNKLNSELIDLGFLVSDSQANFIWLHTGKKTFFYYNYLFDNGIEVKSYDDCGLRISVGSKEQNNYFLNVMKELDDNLSI